MNTAQVSWAAFSSLQGFWPGLQATWGDAALAEETMVAFFSLWTAFGFAPERFDLISVRAYDLRLQFVFVCVSGSERLYGCMHAWLHACMAGFVAALSRTSLHFEKEKKERKRKKTAAFSFLFFSLFTFIIGKWCGVVVRVIERGWKKCVVMGALYHPHTHTRTHTHHPPPIYDGCCAHARVAGMTKLSLEYTWALAAILFVPSLQRVSSFSTA